MHDENISYPLPLETLPSLEFSKHFEDLVEFRDFLEDRGIRTANTRIERYAEYLRQASGGSLIEAEKIFKGSIDGPFEHSTDWLLYVLREAHELMWILKGLKTHTPRGVDDKLKIIVGGRDFAAMDRDSRSRDTQFELRIASYFCQSGCDVDLSSETDIVAISDDQIFYLECKRIGSKNQLAKRLSEAKKQLHLRIPKKKEGRNLYGCIAADVTKAVFPHNGLTFAVTNEHSRDVVQQKLIEITDAAKQLPLFDDCRNLFGYWFQIHIPSFVLHPPTPMTRFSSSHLFRNVVNRKERRSVSAFQEIFDSSSKDDPRLLPAQPLKPRRNFTFPAGTIFSFDETLFEEYWHQGAVATKGMNDEIARLTINGQEHIFSFFEFTMILPSLTEHWRTAMAEKADLARLELVTRMYAQRFRYEES